MNCVNILIPHAFKPGFDYRAPDGMELAPGMVVKVPFGTKERVGVVWGAGSGEVLPEKLKDILAAYPDVPVWSEAFRQWLSFVADYTQAPLAEVVALALSVPTVFHTPKRPRPELEAPLVDLSRTALAELSPEQAAIIADWRTHQQTQEFSVSLLDGVTGSGKTEVYMEAIVDTIRAGKQALVMMPEIVLTKALLSRFKERLGFKPVVWHSALSPRLRREQWKQVVRGQAPLVLGARSALFLPYRSLGLVVVDEEHDGSYKQEEGVSYQARDMAIARAHHEQIPVILASATPSIETLVNVEQGRYRRYEMPARYNDAAMPSIEVIDLRKEKLAAQQFIAPRLRQALTETLAAGLQSLLFLNRKGFAPLMICRSCGHMFDCVQCSAHLVLHQKPTPHLQCHHCGYRAMVPVQCPECKADHTQLGFSGPGVERIAEEVATFLPTARIAVLTSETMQKPKEFNATLEAIHAREVDILIGTQVLAKGHHLPALTLVGVLDATISAEGGDFRASERMFQLLQQVSGRAGRSEHKGAAILQSYQPDHPVIHALLSGQRQAWERAEIQMRKRANMPPYGRLASIILSGKDEEKLKQATQTLCAAIPASGEIRVLGPAPAPLYLWRGQYRQRFLVKAPKHARLQEFVTLWRHNATLPSSIRLKLDIDPYNFF